MKPTLSEPQCLPLPELSALLAPAADADDLTEHELLRHAREVRQRIWQERYEQMMRAQAEEQVYLAKVSNCG